MLVGFDIVGGDMPFESGSQGPEMEVTVDPAELLAGFDHACGAPAQCHRSVLPVFDVAGVIPTDFDHAFHAVGAAQGAGQGGWYTQAQDGQGLVQALA